MLGFRVWDSEKNCFMEDGYFWTDEHGSVYHTSGDNMGINTERFIPMQSTGLKDRDNNEIYEGDIIRIDNDSNVITIKSTVDFLQQSVSWANLIYNYYLSLYGIEKTLQEVTDILGNAYEYPELMEKL